MPQSTTSSQTGSDAFGAPAPPTLRRPLLALMALYLAGGLVLDAVQLALTIMQLGGGPVAQSDPAGVYVALPAVAPRLQRLAIAWASVGVVVHIGLGGAVGIGLGRKAKAVHVGGQEDTVRAKARGLLLRWWVPWSVMSLVVWAVYVGLQTGVYVPGNALLGGAVPECREDPGLSQCGLVQATWALGLFYIVLNLVMLGQIGLVFRRFGTARAEPASSSAPDAVDVIGVADAPQWRWTRPS